MLLPLALSARSVLEGAWTVNMSVCYVCLCLRERERERGGVRRGCVGLRETLPCIHTKALLSQTRQRHLFRTIETKDDFGACSLLELRHQSQYHTCNLTPVSQPKYERAQWKKHPSWSGVVCQVQCLFIVFFWGHFLCFLVLFQHLPYLPQPLLVFVPTTAVKIEEKSST